MNATVLWSNKGPIVMHEYKGVRASMRLCYSKLPEWIDKHAVTFFRICRINVWVQRKSFNWIVELLAHEWGHAYREKKLGILNHAWTYVTRHKQIEHETDVYDEAYQSQFREAAREICLRGFFGEGLKKLAGVVS